MEAQYARFKGRLLSNQDICRDILYMPAQWSAGAKVNWYDDFGYENFFLIAGLYPELAIRLFRIGGAMGLCRSRLVARAVQEGIYPHALLMGEDICDQRGPMISPELLREYYVPELARGLEPLLEVGCRPVWHSDGDVRPLLDMLIEAGIEGFQGYQPECGVTLDLLVEKRTRDGNPLLLFGPMAVTTELPVMTPAEVREKVRRAILTCQGKADLVLFTSNTINPDVPLENVRAMYEEVRNA
jgi:uroporphyrinogen decarboxylase